MPHFVFLRDGSSVGGAVSYPEREGNYAILALNPSYVRCPVAFCHSDLFMATCETDLQSLGLAVENFFSLLPCRFQIALESGV